MINPFGTIFNPYSIKNIAKRVVEQIMFTADDLFYHQDVWKSFELHSTFNQADKQDFLDLINTQILQANKFLQSAKVVLITLGTAWVYKYKQDKEIVSNCHKVSSKEFEKILLSTSEIIEELNQLINLLKSVNKNIKFVMTVSPVRHLKDGFIENQHSKSNLISAVHQIVDNKTVFYFPSYELMMDDLRDYRFYADDMIHPNSLAINYIWAKFKNSFIQPDSFIVMKKVEEIQKVLQHKSFNPTSPAHINLMNKTHQKILDLQEKYPWMNFK
jgi:hypothetical protein